MQQIPMLMVTNTGHEIYELVLARDVKEFLIEYWDSRIEEWSTEWLFTNQLPQLVRVALATGTGSPTAAPRGRREPANYYTTMISVASTNVTVNMQMATPAAPPIYPNPGVLNPGSPNAPGSPNYPGNPGLPGNPGFSGSSPGQLPGGIRRPGAPVRPGSPPTLPPLPR